MTNRHLARAAILFLVPLWIAGASAEDAPKSGNAVFDKTVEIVDEHFFSPAALPHFMKPRKRSSPRAAATGDPLAVDGAVKEILASLKAPRTPAATSPTRSTTSSSWTFSAWRSGSDLRRLFPPEGEITYEGIGIASKVIDGKRFVTDVYDGGPAMQGRLSWRATRSFRPMASRLPRSARSRARRERS